MERDQVDRSEESMDEFDSDAEELFDPPADWRDRDNSDYTDSDADSDGERDELIAAIDEEALWADYDFEFPVRTGAPIREELFV